MQVLEDYCWEKGLRLMDPRRYVFEIITGSAVPLSAYHILEALGKKLRNPKPPTAYRAIDFLAAHKFIHRIESLNAYVTCGAGHHHSGAQFAICDSCGCVTEIHLCSVPESLQKKTAEQNFQVSYWNVELHGTCRKCS